ncbi:MAG: glucosamine/fructose-6-phosphate aminotransferase, isomerizing [Candidatus Saccharibacteria bacterium]|nr:glucosamine/fructose-6-phosphate aminotransferase, isomerizing [Candidatus Saccharibacteria bacterium]
MCGIVGFIGERPATPIVMQGLQALEYRGYDSAGVSTVTDGRITTTRQVGQVADLSKILEDSSAMLAIGHTRWATHGAPSITNAHPHSSADGSIAIVHNGIIENHEQLRTKLQQAGYEFKSETDTEVIPHLIDYYFKQTKSIESAFHTALRDLRGAYAIAVVSSHEPDTLYAARLSSPLVIGVGDNEYILASDPTALIQHTKKVIYLNDFDVARITTGDLAVTNLESDSPTIPEVELLDLESEDAQKGHYEHFMIKEINEAPQTIQSAIRGRVLANEGIVKLGGLDNVVAQLRYIDRIVIVACGTSFYAGLVGEYLIEELAGIPVEVQQASEFKYRSEPFSRGTAILAVSQSGETADTIAALDKVKDYGVLRLGIVNAPGSTIARMTDAGVYCHAGPEQAVASTKAFIAQVTVLALIALHLSNGSTKDYKPLLKELVSLPDKAAAVLALSDQIKVIAEKYAPARDFLFIGRHYGYPCALEGALKLKEVSYIHAEGYAAGEMKHGPLAMIDENFPTFAIATDSPLLEKTMSNIQEIRARSGPVIALATEGNEAIAQLADDVIYLPPTLEQTQPLLISIATQLFAYHVAVARGFNVDRPRNLAKSVTVE